LVMAFKIYRISPKTAGSTRPPGRVECIYDSRSDAPEDIRIPWTSEVVHKRSEQVKDDCFVSHGFTIKCDLPVVPGFVIQRGYYHSRHYSMTMMSQTLKVGTVTWINPSVMSKGSSTASGKSGDSTVTLESPGKRLPSIISERSVFSRICPVA